MRHRQSWPLMALFLVTSVSFLSTSPAAASISNVYLSQNGAGSGASCSDAFPVSWFNVSANWGSGSTQIGPGTTVHLCGTFAGSPGATEFTFMGSGASGNPVTLHFETGALLTAPYWSANGAINTNGATWITIDGGTNGTIQNTLNGTSGGTCPGGTCSDQQESGGVVIVGCTTCNIEVRNLTIADIYDHSSTSDTQGKFTFGIYFVGGLNNITIDHNTVHDAWLCLNGWGSNILVYNNTIYGCSAQFWFGTNAPTSSLVIHDNLLTMGANWGTTGDTFHLDGINIFPDTSPAQASGVMIYNNHFTGGGSCCNTGHIFLEGDFINPQVFNNFFDNSNGASPYHAPSLWLTNEGLFTFSNPLVVNNTFFGGDETFGGNVDFQAYGATGITFQNNVVAGSNQLVLLGNTAGGVQSTFTTVNNNVYESLSGVTDLWAISGSNYTTLAAWQSATGGEANSVLNTLANLDLNSDGTLASGSPAIQRAANLTSLGITALDRGAPQTFGATGSCGTGCVARVSSGAWDSGAYPYSTTAPPAPPTGLTAIVQ